MTASPTPQAERLNLSDRYRVVRKLGSGSMGTVYLAHDAQEDHEVALKLIRTDRLAPECILSLQKEFRVLTGLRHPRIAPAHDFGYTERDRLPFFTRAYIAGSPLRPGPPRGVSADTFLRPLLDLLDALHYLHAHEILHLDIHSGNVIESKDSEGRGVLIDFGLIRPLGGPGFAVTLRADSPLPPDFSGEERVGPATDLHSVGRLLLFRVTGSTTHEGKLPREIPGWGPRVTLELERIIAKATQRDPAKRFASARDFREALAGVVGAQEAPSFVEPAELTVGRDQELALLEESLRRAATGVPAVVWFVGPAGIGKSRLLTEARLSAQLRGMELVETRFLPRSPGEPRLLECLRLHCGQRRSSASWLETMDISHGGSTRDRSRRAARACLDARGPPLVILLDDLEQADRESLMLAQSLASEIETRAARRVASRGVALIVASSAPFARELPLSDRRKALRCVRPLGSKEAERLLEKLLRPLNVPKVLLTGASRRAGGSPLRLRQIARSVHTEWGQSGTVPLDARLPVEPNLDLDTPCPIPERPEDSAVLSALAVIERPASRREIEVTTRLSRGAVLAALRRLRETEAVVMARDGRTTLYFLNHPEARKRLVETLAARQVLQIHERAIEFLRGAPSPDCATLENLAHHLLAAGKRSEARRNAYETARLLRERGLLDGALRLLTRAAEEEADPRWRLRFLEEISSVHHETGDHDRGMAVLAPIFRERHGKIPRAAAVRLRRRLAVHCHRAGAIEEATRLFREVRALAHPKRDIQELIIVDSELAELHTLRGEYAEAESACSRGLAMLSGCEKLDEQFRSAMELMLRASMGHLELRRMNFEAAREELEAASALARRSGTTATQALVLNNLGIAYNHLNDLSASARCYAAAGEVLRRSGERSGSILVAANLATIAAKTGDVARAKSHIDQASRLVVHYPGKRVDFSVKISRAVVAHLLGDLPVAQELFKEAIAAGAPLGDEQSLVFAATYLAEAEAGCGAYGPALKRLRAVAGKTRKLGMPSLERMVFSRLFAVERLCGQRKAAESTRSRLRSIPRTDGLLLESWVDLFVALGHALLEEEPAAALYLAALRVFERLGIPAGRGFARIGLLGLARQRGEVGTLLASLRNLRKEPEAPNKFLAVLAPLERAEVALLLDDTEQTESCLREASGAIVGLPFLELDWRIEFLRARLAERRDDRESARRYLHRCLYTRDLLSRSLPPRMREGFLDQRRFAALAELAKRLERLRPTPVIPARAGKTGSETSFHGMVGRSQAIRNVFETVEKLRDQDMSVLISGGTGSGKELVARAIHRTSLRRDGPFFALHCASLPTELFESELFGYDAGAFTGAERPHPGILESLSGGTLLLDAIGNLSLEGQSKLLRVIDTRKIRRVGGSATLPVDVRFLASSIRSGQELVEEGRLREDLYFRLARLEIRLPPLSDRKEDIPDLVGHFLRMHARRTGRVQPHFGAEAMESLKNRDWPGNVRQLETVILRILLLSSPGTTVDRDQIASALPTGEERPLVRPDLLKQKTLKELKEDLERQYLLHLFRETEGDIRKVADSLEVNQATLYRWLRKLELDVRALRRDS